MILFASPSIAATYYWQVPAGTSDDWSHSGNWGGTLPAPNDTAYIVNGGTANVATSGDACYNLFLGSGAGSGTVNMTAGSLFVANNLNDGYSGTGSFTQSGGTNSSSIVTLGYYNGSSGSYTLKGNGLLSATIEYVGVGGPGNFSQSGGTNAASSLYLYGPNAIYNLSSNGLLNATAEVMGLSGTGIFTQSGGTNSAGSLTLGYNSTGHGTYNLNGGLLIVSAMTNASGAAAFNFGGGTLRASGSFTTTLPMTLTGTGGGATFDTAGNTVTLSGQLTGTSSLTKIGIGTLILSGTNTYQNGTTVNGGNLQFGSTSSIPPYAGSILINSSGAVNVTGAYTTLGVTGWLGSGKIATSSSGALALNGNSSESFSVGSYHSISLGAAQGVSVTYSGTLTPYNNTYYLGGGGGTLTYSSSINSGSLVLNAGPGIVILTNTNTYTGGTTVNTGVLEAAIPSALPQYSISSKLSVASGATIAVAVGGAGQWSSGNIDTLLTNTGAFQPGSSLGFDTTAQSFTYSTNIGDDIHGPSGMGLTKLGTNTLTLSGNNSYSGGTTISGGTLQLGNVAALSTGNVAIATGVLDLYGYNPIVTSLSGSGTITNGGSVQAAMTVNALPGASPIFPGVITDGAGTVSLTKSGAGTLMLSGLNTYSGGTTIGGGTLQCGNTNALGTGSVSLLAGVLDLAGSSTTIGALSTALGTTITNNTLSTAATLTTNFAGGTTTLAGAITDGAGTVSLTVSGAGKVIFSGNNTYSGTTTVCGTPTVVVTNPNAFGSSQWNLAPDKGNGTLDLQCGSLPAGQVLITAPFYNGSGFIDPTVYHQLGNFTIVSDAATAGSAGVTYAAGNAYLAVANSAYSGNSGNVGRTMTVQGGANVTSGIAGLSFSTFQVYVQPATPTPYPPGTTTYAPVTFNIVNPVGGGFTLLSIGSLNISSIVDVNTTSPFSVGYGEGNLILTGNGNFNVTTALTTGGSFTLGAGYSGLVQLSGTNTISNGITVSGGNLQFNSINSVPTSGSILINSGGAVNVTGAYSTITGWLGSGKITASSSGALALTGNSSENHQYGRLSRFVAGRCRQLYL